MWIGQIEPKAADGLDWGSVPDWVAVLGTIAAFLIAAVTYFRSVADQREAQARLVFSRLVGQTRRDAGQDLPIPGEGTADSSLGRMYFNGPGDAGISLVKPAVIYEIEVTNLSSELIAGVAVEFIETGREELLQGLKLTLGPVFPNSTKKYSATIFDRWHPGVPSVLTRVVFRDARGRWWQRIDDEPIGRLPERLVPKAPKRSKRLRSLSSDDPPINPNSKSQLWHTAPSNHLIDDRSKNSSRPTSGKGKKNRSRRGDDQPNADGSK